VKLAPGFVKEVFAHYKRRLVEFISTPKELITCLGPFLMEANLLVIF